MLDTKTNSMNEKPEIAEDESKYPFVLNYLKRLSCIRSMNMINLREADYEVIAKKHKGDFDFKISENCCGCGTFNVVCFVKYEDKKDLLIFQYLTLGFYNAQGNRIKTREEIYADKEMLSIFAEFYSDIVAYNFGADDEEPPECCGCGESCEMKEVKLLDFLNIKNTLTLMKNVKDKSSISFDCDCMTTRRIMEKPVLSEAESEEEFLKLPKYEEVYNTLK